MRTLLSFVAILLLATSSLPIGFADTTPVDSLNIESIEQPITQTRKTISVSLDETMELSTDSPRKKQINSTPLLVEDTTTKLIHLDEGLIISESTSDQKIHFDSVIIQPQVTIERILQTDKSRDDRKKNLKIESFYLNDLDQQQSDNFVLIDSNILQTTFFADPFKSIIDPISEQNILEIINIFEEQSFINIFDYVSNFDLSFVLDNSFVVVIFTPLVFFLFIFAEDVKFKFEKIRPILSFVCVFIILSTVIVTPYSISSSYWPEAYADTGDMNDIIYDNTTVSDDVSSSSTPAEDTESSEATTSDNTSTSVDSISSSSTPAEDTESTEVSSSTQPTASTDDISSSSTPAEDTESSEATTSNSTDTSVGSISSSSTPAEDTESTEVSSSTQPTASTDDISSSSTPAEDTDASEATTSNTDTPVESTSSSSTPAEDTESTGVSSSTQPTASTDDISSSSTPAEDTESSEATTSNQTSINDSVTNSTITNDTTTDVIPVNGTISGTNSTGVIPVNGTISGTNSTGVIPVNGTISGTNSTGVIPVNGTISGTNSTGVIPVNGTISGTNSTVIPVNGTISGTNSTGVIPVNGTISGTNSTGVIPTNGTISGTNSTGVIPVNGTISGTNSTGVIPTNGTISGTNSTGVIPTNGTISGTNSTGVDIPIILPNATESWQFDTQVNGSRFIGDVYIEETDSSLILDGDGYVSNDGNSTSDISNLSVTAWVNPDYSGGSSEFTVVSKEKSFALTINNNIDPQHIAKFAVFDGIKWHTVETSTQIGNDWSHIAATFNGTTLSIYTNGTLSNVNESVEIISMTIHGELELQTIETANSTSDVIIGASLENQRSVDDVTKQFNGEIKEINIFNVYLTAQQVTEIYLQTLPMIQSLYNNTTIEIIEDKEIVIIDVLAPKIITNSTNINGTNIDITNSTDNTVTFNDTQNYIPISEESLNKELNKLTISTWINPSYTSGSAEFTVVSKESSFVLGINNIYSPEKIPTFAIFDGITWTKIVGTTQINDWSHLVAVINGTEISLYLNGNLESQSIIPESFVILDGEVSPVSAEVAENESDVIIGAYLSTLRSKVSLSNHFSGSIDDVLIYKEALSKAQIDEIYADYINPSDDYEIPFESHLLSFTDNITVTLSSANSTEVFVASVNATSDVPSMFQSVSLADYVSYKLNDSTISSSIDILSFDDAVVAIVNQNATSDVQSMFQSVSLTDHVSYKLNGITFSSSIDTLSFDDAVVALVNQKVTSNKEAVSLQDTLQITLNGRNIFTVDSLSLSDNVIIRLNGEYISLLSETLTLEAIIIDQSNNTSLVEIAPKVTSMKESYLITEDAEFEFDFFISSEILEKEKLKLENVTDVLTDELEQSLSDSEITPVINDSLINSTSTITEIISNFKDSFSVQMADAAKLNSKDITDDEIKNTKSQVKELKRQIKELSKSEELDEKELEDIKHDLKKTLEDLKSTAKTLEKGNNSEKAEKIMKAINSVEDAAGIEPIQKDSWIDSQNTITTEVFDSAGNLVTMESKYEKIRDGKFNLKIAFDNNNKPGLYKIKTTFTMNGQDSVVEKEFAWGLVSLNTAKSIYQPGDISDFIIVVLDNEGHPVCDANLSMNITDPNSQITTLSSGNGITANQECGLYDAQFTTAVEGIHNVDINAQASGINTNFSTTFSVLEYFEFDIVRTALSKIDPVTNPNSFDVTINIESFVDEGAIIISETVPNVFDVVTDAHIETVGNYKVLTWTKDLIDNKTSVEYSYSVPFEFPKLYALGPIEILYNESLLTFEEARPWFVASDPPAYESGNVYVAGTAGSGEKGSEQNYGAVVVNPTNSNATVTQVNICVDVNDPGFASVAEQEKPTSGWSITGPVFGTECIQWNGSLNVTAHDALDFRARSAMDNQISASSITFNATVTGVGTISDVSRGSLSSLDKDSQVYIHWESQANDETETYHAGLNLDSIIIREDTLTNPLSSDTAYNFTVNYEEFFNKITATGGQFNVTVPSGWSNVSISDDTDFGSSANVSGSTLLGWNITATPPLIAAQTAHLTFEATTPGDISLQSTHRFNATCIDCVGDKGTPFTIQGDAIVIVVAPVLFDETISLDDKLSKSVIKSLTESVEFNDIVTVYLNGFGFTNVQLTESLGISDSVEAERFVERYESLDLTDDLDYTQFVSPAGESSVFLGINVGCGKDTFTSYQNVELGTSYEGCNQQDEIVLGSTTTSEESLALFYLNYEFGADAVIQGYSTGSNLNFVSKDEAGTLKLKLVQVDISGTPTVDKVLRTQSQLAAANEDIVVTDISSLFGLVEKGFTLGLEYTFTADNSNTNDKEILWGKEGGTVVELALDVLFKAKADDTLSISDKLNKDIVKAKSESLGIVDQLNKDITKAFSDSVAFTDDILIMFIKSMYESIELNDKLNKDVIKTKQESLGLDAKLNKKITISAPESIGFNDQLSLVISKSLTESIVLNDQITKSVSFALTESLTLDDNLSKATTFTLTESLSLDDNLTKATTFTLTESLPLDDQITKSLVASLSESLTLDDKISKIATFTLTESLTLDDQLTMSITVPLSESLTLDDNLTKTFAFTLTESLTLDDQITKIATFTLTESLTLDDNLTKIATFTLTESLPLDDNLTKTFAFTLTESLPLDDQIKKSLVASFSESLTLDDNLTKTFAFTLTESLTLDDNLTKTFAFTLTESLPLDDQIKKSLVASFSESLTLDDQITKTFAFTLTESLTLDDNLTKTFAFTLTESLTLDDNLTKTFAFTLTESLTLDDNLTKTFAFTLTESLTLDDQITKTFAFTLTESLTLDDNLTKTFAFTLTESLTLDDNLTKTFAFTLTESLTLDDQITKTFAFTLTESLTLDDNLTKTFAFTLTESLTLDDQITKTFAFTLTESLTLDDNLTKTFAFTLTESLTLDDNLTKTFAFTLTESLTLDDNLTKTFAFTLTESLTLDDNLTKTFAFTLTESLTLDDNLTKTFAFTLTESLTLDDNLTKTFAFTLTESLTLDDQITKTFAFTLTESLTLDDNLTKTFAFTLTESLTLDDQITKTFAFTLTESLTLDDQITKTFAFTLTESLTLDDQITKTFAFTLTESLTLDDQITKTFAFTLTESLTLDDNLTKTFAFTLTESLTLDDQITKTFAFTLTESLTLDDQITKTFAFTLTESLTLDDQITKTFAFTLTESLTLDDQITKTFAFTLTESLTLDDQIRKTLVASLFESLTLDDTLARTASFTLTESLPLDDTLARTASFTLTESLPLDDTLARTATFTLTESLTLDDTLARTASFTLTESLLLNGHLSKTFTVPLTESLTLDDTLARTASFTLTESLTLDDQITKTFAFTLTESLTLDDNLSSNFIVVNLAESLTLTDEEIDAIHITVPAGGATILFGLNPGGEDCIQDTFTSFQTVGLVESNNGCPKEDKIQLTTSTTNEENIALFFLDNGGYDVDAQIIGLSSSNDINFKSFNVDGTLKIKLVQVNASTFAVEEILDTQNESAPSGDTIIISNLSPLVGIIDSGNTFGILVTFTADSSDSNKKELKWGKDNQAGKEFKLALDISLSSAATESLSLSDQFHKSITKSLTESLSLDEKTESPGFVRSLFTESLTLDDNLDKATTFTLTESLSLDDEEVNLAFPIALTESLTLTDEEIEVIYITVPTGSATILFGLNPGGEDCNADTFNSFQTVGLVESNNGCSQEDKIQLTTSTTNEENIALFFLDNGGFTSDAQIIGLPTNNDINFKSFDVAGTLKIKLVQVNASTFAVEEILDTTTKIAPENTRIIVSSISPLAGVADSGSTFGILVTFTADSSVENKKELKWGKDNQAGKQFKVAFDITTFSAANESLSLSDQLDTSITKSLTESLSLDDKRETAGFVRLHFTESLPLDDGTVDVDSAFTFTLTESLTLDDNLMKTATPTLTESLTLTDELQTIVITTPIGAPSILFGLNPGGEDCIQDTFTSFQTVGLVESNNGCPKEDKIQLTTSTTNEENIALFFLDNGGYDVDAQIVGLPSGSDINFKSFDVAGTLKIKLVQVNPSTQVIEKILDTQNESIPENTSVLISDISSLAGVVDSGSTLGILVTFTADSSVENKKELKWGKDNQAGKQFKVTFDIILFASATESLSLSDQFHKSITKSLTESLSLDDKLNKDISVAQTESLPLDDNTVDYVRTVHVTLDESLPLDDNISKILSTSLDESLLLDDNTSRRVSFTLTESLPLDDNTVDSDSAFTFTLTESLPLDDNISKTLSTSLIESLSLDDNTVDSDSAFAFTLTESLPLDDTLARTASFSLTESLPLDDNVSRTASFTLTESLSLDDNTVDTDSAFTFTLTELLPLDDTLARTASFTLTESLPLHDNVSRTASFSLTESLPLDDDTVDTDSAFTFTLTESLSLDDNTVDTDSAFTFTLTELLPLDDTLARTASFSLIELLPLDDNVSRTFSASLIESLSLNDNTVDFVHDFGIFVSLDESLSLDDTLAGTASFSLTESLPLDDNLARTTAISFTESLPLDDNLARTTAISFTESLPLDDNLAKSLAIPLTESLSLDDNLARTTTVSFTESLSLDDNLARTTAISFTESLSLDDNLAKSLAIPLTESLSLDDNLARTTTVSFTESLSLDDNLARTTAISFTESLPLDDNLARTTAISFTESLPLDDNLAKSLAIPLTESLSLDDNLARTTTVSFTESLSLDDKIIKTLKVSFTESLSIDDGQIDSSPIHYVFLEESLLLDATVDSDRAATFTFTESLPLDDNLARTTAISFTESLPLDDNLARTTAISFTESLSIDDGTVDLGNFKFISLMESLFLDDKLTKSLAATITESLSLDGNTVDSTKTVRASLSESLSLDDKLTKSLTSTLTESLPLDDTVDSTSFTLISLTESLSLDDKLTKTIISTLTESLPLDDTVDLTKSFTFTLSESLSLDDKLTKSLAATITESLPLDDTVDSTSFTLISLTESLSLDDKLTKTTTSTLTESLPLDDTVDLTKSFTFTLNESLSFDDKLAKIHEATLILSESLSLDDKLTKTITIPLTESLTLDDTLARTIAVTFTESLPLDDNLANIHKATSTLTESLSLDEMVQTVHYATVTLTESLGLSDSSTELVNIGENQVLIDDQQTTVIVTDDNKELVITNSNALLNRIELHKVTNTVINYTTILTGTNVTMNNALKIVADLDDHHPAFDVKVDFADITTISGPIGWDGLLKLPSLVSITIPDTETQTFSEITAFEIGLSSAEITFDEPVRIEFTQDGGNQNFEAFFKRAGDTSVTFITTVCNLDDLAAVKTQLGGTGECVIDDGTDLIVWTFHGTSFGDSRKSSKSVSPSPSSPSGTSSGGGGGGGGGSGGSGYKEIPGSSLAINEISYDKCNDNMARILVSSDADMPPTVMVSTAKSGVVYGTLAEVQPYEDLNKFSTVDRYLYEIPITSEESFMMVSVTEEIGIISNTVQALVKLLSCEGTTVIVPLPEDTLPDVSEATARIFDTKVQIGNATSIDAAESEFLYVTSQELTVSAIIDSETPLERVEIRSITMGQPDSDYIGIEMDVTPLYVSNSTYVVTGTIPSFWMVEPGMTYWLHITDKDAAQTESIHYNIGAKPSSVSEIAVEVDMPTIKASGSIVKPEFYLFNEDEPSFGIVSLVVDGEVVSKRSQFFGTGQTQIIFNWNTPKSDGYVEYDIQGVVELYHSKVSTSPSILATHPKTVTVSGTEMPALQVIQRDDTILADPALVYASNADSTARFTVTDPQGQCIIGGADECLVNDSTRANRGGLESIPYGDQILRVRYSGADNALERFSITSIDPIVGQWSVSLESEDGYVQQAHAAEDIVVKIKYRYHSETITSFSQ